jgi:hypothetical protein
MTDVKYQYLRVALGGLLMAGTVCAFETGARAQSQCQPRTINVQDCFVELKKTHTRIDVNPPDVGLYSGTKLSWQYKPVPPAKPNFAVDFDIDCTPFVDHHFDQGTPKTAHGADSLSSSQFERCKYRVTIDRRTVDPHVIVVGGSRGHHHDDDEHKDDDKHR